RARKARCRAAAVAPRRSWRRARLDQQSASGTPRSRARVDPRDPTPRPPRFFSCRTSRSCCKPFRAAVLTTQDDEYPMGKYLRDARVLTLNEATSQIQQLIIGRSLTGINAM